MGALTTSTLNIVVWGNMIIGSRQRHQLRAARAQKQRSAVGYCFAAKGSAVSKAQRIEGRAIETRETLGRAMENEQGQQYVLTG